MPHFGTAGICGSKQTKEKSYLQPDISILLPRALYD